MQSGNKHRGTSVRTAVALVYERIAANRCLAKRGRRHVEQVLGGDRIDTRITGIAVLDGESTRVISLATMLQEQSRLKRVFHWVYLRLKWSREVRRPAYWLALRLVAQIGVIDCTARHSPYPGLCPRVHMWIDLA